MRIASGCVTLPALEKTDDTIIDRFPTVRLLPVLQGGGCIHHIYVYLHIWEVGVMSRQMFAYTIM